MMHLNFRKYLLIALICGSVGYGLRSQQESQSLTQSTQPTQQLTTTPQACINPSAPKSVSVLLTEFTRTTQSTDAAPK